MRRIRSVSSMLPALLLAALLTIPAGASEQHRWVDGQDGHDTNSGTGPEFGSAWKTITHALASIPAASEDNPVIIHVLPAEYDTDMGSGDREYFPLEIHGDEGHQYLTLQGEGDVAEIVISADDSSAALNVMFTNHITLQDLTLKEGHADEHGNAGGGIFCTDSDHVTIQGCVVTSNVGYYGGGIHISTTVGNVLIDDCVVHDNESSSGTGGGICCKSSTTIRNCIIYRNKIAAAAQAKTGGGIYVDRDSIIDGCVLQENEAALGAGIYLTGDSTIDGCDFWGNVATAGGGGMICSGNASPEITGCTFYNGPDPEHPHPNEAPLGGGLTLRTGSKPTITDCAFDGNSATSAGGGIYCIGGSNLAMSGGGVTDNTAPVGGGIYCAETHPTFDAVAISGNEATTGNGGGIYITGESRPRFDDCTISSNRATEGNGGGVFVDTNCAPRFMGCSMTDNEAPSGYGGGVYCYSGSSPIFRQTALTWNEADRGAGAYLNGCSWDFAACELTDNTASQDGGGVYLTGGSTAEFGSNLISDNAATTGSGGGIYSAQSDLILTGNMVTLNGAAAYGGGLCISDGSVLSLDGFDRITVNTAGDGGGGIYYSDSGGTALNTIIDANMVTDHPEMGAGVLCDSGAGPEFACCTIHGNLDSGVVATGGATPTLTNCILWGNTLDVDGLACSQISHCDIQDGSCYGANDNFVADPLFVLFYEGEAEEEQTFYLSHTAAGQADNSLCINAGDDQALAYGCDVYTTASDGRRDKGVVDVGAHYEDRWRGGRLYYVDAEAGDDTNDGSETTPWRTITHALTQVDGESLEPKTIVVESGTYSETMHSTQHETFPLEMEEFVALEAATTDSYAKTLDGEGNHRVINISVDHVAIHGLTIQNGDGNDETDTEGGGIRLENAGGGVILTKNVIKDCTATEGGGIHCVSSLPCIERCTLTGNTAYNGAGISLASGSDPDLVDNDLSTNTASNLGGGVYIGNGCSPTVNLCTVYDNQGGGLYMGDDCSPPIRDCTISGNSGVSCGAGIRMGDRCSPPIDSSSIYSNISSGEGGGVYMGDSCSPTIADCAVDSNSASTKGGAMYVGSDSAPVLINSSMNTNDCDAAGGAVAFVGSGNAELTGCTMGENSAGTDGGAVLCESGATPSFSNCKMIYNDADRDGGAIACLSGSTPTFEGNFLESNTCSQYGGAIFCSGGSQPLFEAGHEIQRNEAGEAGGAMYCSDSASPYVFCALIEGNSAARPGGCGGIACCSSSAPEFWSCTITDNRKGGVFATGGAAPTLTNCIVWNNGNDLDGLSCDHVNHCCIQDGDCEGENGNIADDPLLVPLPMRPCYLSHEEAGQSHTSPCIDAGLGQSSDYGLDQSTTRTDGELDGGTVDIGFHWEHGLNSFYVDCKNGDDGNSGTSADDAWKTITHAVEQEGLGTEEDPAFIQVAPGLYDTDNNDEDGPFQPKPWTMLLGAGAEDDEDTGSIIDGTINGTSYEEAFRFYRSSHVSAGCFWIRKCNEYGAYSYEAESVVLHDCVITDMHKDTSYAAIYLRNSTNTRVLRCRIIGNGDDDITMTGLECFYGDACIEYCEISNNHSDDLGAGVLLNRASTTLLGCTVSDNVSDEPGAGVYANSGFTMKNCTISNNTASGAEASGGGGLEVTSSYSGDRILIDCTIFGNVVTNTAETSCGGGARLAGPVEVSGCIFEGNTCDEQGGGIYFSPSSTQILRNCLIVGNSAGEGTGNGSAIYCASSADPELINCTIEGNDGTGVDGGSCNALTLTNCIIYNNGDDVVNVDCSQMSHCDIGNDDEECAGDENGNISDDPLFVPRNPEDENEYTGYYLAQTDAQGGDSPCLNKGDDQASAYSLDALTTCTDGRCDEGVVDIGYHHKEAYEGGDNTYIELVSFEAKPKSNSILIIWETGTEIDNAGFNLYRIESGDRTTRVKINGRLIHAEGAPAIGASYELLDTDVSPGITYDYYLVDIDRSGTETVHGPVSARILARPRVVPDDRTSPHIEQSPGRVRPMLGLLGFLPIL